MNLSNGDAVHFKQGSKSKHTPRPSIISIVSLISRKKLKISCIFLKNKLNKKPQLTSHPKKIKNQKTKTKVQNETKAKQKRTPHKTKPHQKNPNQNSILKIRTYMAFIKVKEEC